MSPEIVRYIVGALFIFLILAFVGSIIYGRRVVKTEVTDAVFGNPVRALGGWYWVITGVCSILLLWFYFSWDAARAFFPNSANEMCQVARVDSEFNALRSTFPMQSRLLKSTSFLDRETTQIENARRRIRRSNVEVSVRDQYLEAADTVEAMLLSRASADSLSSENRASIATLAERIDAATAKLADPSFPGPATEAEQKAADEQPGWGEGIKKEIPDIPNTDRGRKFFEISKEAKAITKDFTAIRNVDDDFKEQAKALTDGLKALQTSGDDAEETKALTKSLDKIVKRIDDGNIFPPTALDPIEDAMKRFNAEQSKQKGNLKILDAVAMPGGEIRAGSTACTEQGSGRWLPKPSDTMTSLIKISDPAVGFKAVPLLWYEWKPASEMLAFFIPDWIADLVPGEYPRHAVDGFIDTNLKTKVLNLATGNYPSFSIPVPAGHLWDSIMRVLAGLFLGIILGVPLGLFMGLSRFAKGFFDPLIELYRPVPPLAWAPLILTIFGINDDGKIFLLFMVAFAIMVISARTGATGTQLSKIHAAHSLGASNRQIIRRVILPNSLPEILTGIRIAIGVCWGTLVAAEMLAGTTGIGFIENVARKQSNYEIIWVTIILLGLLGLLFDLIMRWIIARTIPWRGKG